MSKVYKLLVLFLIVFLFSGCINNDDPVDSYYKNEYAKIVTRNRTIDSFGYYDDTLEVKIGDEHFYVIGYEGENVKLLAKYNLLVGGIYNNRGKSLIKLDSNGYDIGDKVSTYGKYGLQSKKAKGYFKDSKERVGTVSFTSSSYWNDNSGSLSSQYGTSFPVWVYDYHSNIKRYIDDYEYYLYSKYNVQAIESRVIKDDELNSINCYVFFSTCDGAADWVRQTSFWTGFISSNYYAVGVSANGSLYGEPGDNYFGVRPVIIVPKNIF